MMKKTCHIDFVTKEEIAKAKSVNLVDFLEDNYDYLVKYDRKTGTLRHIDHDSLVIDPDLWNHFAGHRGGDQIDFLQAFCGQRFQDAVRELCDYADRSCSLPVKKRERFIDEVVEDFYPPAKSSTSDNVKRYLKERGISSDTIDMLISKGLLYEDYSGNCIFFRNDTDKRMCIFRGTRGVKWTKILREIPNNYWFFVIGEDPQNIFICESPIDAVSVYECNHKQDGYYCALAGLKKNSYARIVRDLAVNSDGEVCKKIKLAVDWDIHGIDFINKDVDKSIRFSVLRPMPEEREITKDWNDVLQLRRRRHII